MNGNINKAPPIKSNSLLSFFREHKFVTATIAAVIIISVSILFRLLTPTTKPTPTTTQTAFIPGFIRTRAQQSPIEVNINEGVVVDQTKVNLMTSPDFAPQAFVSNTVSQFGLAPAKRLAEVFYSKDYSVSISTTTTPGLLQYFDENKNPEPSTSVTQAQSENFAKAFMERIGYPVSQLTLDSAEYVNPEEEDEALESTSLRSVQQLVYSRKIDGLDFSFGDGSEQKAFIFTSNKGVFKAYLPALTFSLETVGETNLLPLDIAATQVSAGIFILANSPNLALGGGTQIQSFNITKALVEYRYDQSQKLFIPFYQLTGEATTTNGERGIVVVSTPAITFR